MLLLPELRRVSCLALWGGWERNSLFHVVMVYNRNEELIPLKTRRMDVGGQLQAFATSSSPEYCEDQVIQMHFINC